MMFLIQLNKKMKKSILFVLVFATSTVFGTLIDHFRGWNDLKNGSPNIVIARCTETPGFTPPGITPKPFWSNGGWTSDIEVLSILKGNTKTGLSKLGSFYKPYQGELFVIFATYMTAGTNSWYNAVEEYKIIPLNSDFRIDDLNGKTLDKQIQVILASRLKDLNDEMTRDSEEKQRIESGLNNLTNSAVADKFRH